MELNTEQQNAVAYTDGPIQVVAGPGSGKTHVIIEKVARLVKDGVQPNTILCMTFTEKATDEMRQRLHKKNIDDVWVGTIHALCLDILKENSITTGITEKTMIFSKLAKLAWCVRTIDKLGIDSEIVNIGRDPKKPCKDMLKAVSRAKREMVSVEDLETYARADIADDAKKIGQLTKIYRAYDDYKKEKDLIDYDDMVTMTVEHLSRNKSVLEKYRKKYEHVLIDEFQDNNYAQFLLAKLLAGTGSITVVGDGDQSIMGFQGAFDGIFDEFNGEYPDSKSVILNRNYRCSANISQISSQLLCADAGRKKKHLHAERSDGKQVTVIAASDEAAEREYIAKTISELSVPHSKIAVLCKTNLACQKFTETLRSHGITTALIGDNGMMRNTSVAETLSLLKIADSPDTTGMEISHILKMRGIHEYNIRDINTKAKQQKIADTPVDGVFSALKKYSGSTQDVEIREIVQRLQEMSTYARTADLLEILHKIMMEYSDIYKKNACADGYEAARNLMFLNSIYRVAEDYQHHYYGRRLSDFIEYLDIADSNIDDLEVNNIDAGDTVSVMTIHKSKGKEFDVVFVTGLYDGELPSTRKSEKFEIPRKLLKGKGRTLDAEKAHDREQRNLLYVAMTRARDLLYMTYPRHAKSSPKERKASRFLTDMHYDDNPCIQTTEYDSISHTTKMPQDILDVEKTKIQEEACRAVHESRPEAAVRSMIRLSRILHIQKGGKDDDFEPRTILDMDIKMDVLPQIPKIPLVNNDTLTLSATGIETYQECPLKFKYRKILHIPEKPSIHMDKGSAIHNVLEWMARENLAGHTPDIGEAIRKADEEITSARSKHNDRDYHSVKSSLEGIINNYAKWEKESSNTLVEPEAEFTVHIDGMTYSGKIDRVEKNPDGKYEIVDFKTGSTVVTKEAIKVLPQANIYAIAAKEKYGSLPAKISLVYLAKKTSRIYEVTDESLETGIGVTKDCAKNIVNEQFNATPGEHCTRCSYNGICPAVLE